MKKIKALFLFTLLGFMSFVGYGSMIGSSSEAKLPCIQTDYLGSKSRNVVVTVTTTTTTTTTGTIREPIIVPQTTGEVTLLSK